MSQYLSKRDESYVCRFRCAEDLHSLLSLSPRCDYRPAFQHEHGTRAKCDRSLEHWKLEVTTTLVNQIAAVDIPSPQARHMFDDLSRNRFCSDCRERALRDDKSHAQSCLKLRNIWLELIWWEHLRENGIQVDGKDGDDMIPADFGVQSWQQVLAVIRSPGARPVVAIPLRRKQRDTAGVGKPRVPPTDEMAVAMFAEADPEKIYAARDDDVFRDKAATVNEDDKESDTQDYNRPVLHREMANMDVPKLDSTEAMNAAQANQMSLTNLPKTPRKSTRKIKVVEELPSPESVVSASPSSLFDLHTSSDADTPLSMSEIPPDHQPGIEDSPSARVGRKRPQRSASALSVSAESAVESSNHEESSAELKTKTSPPPNAQQSPSDVPMKPKSLKSKIKAALSATILKERPRESKDLESGEAPVDTTAIAPGKAASEPIHAFIRQEELNSPLKAGLTLLKRKGGRLTAAPGYVYCYRHEEHPGYLKIGSASCTKKSGWNVWLSSLVADVWGVQMHYKPDLTVLPHQVPREVQARYNRWKYDCQYEITHVFSYPMPCAARRIEYLIHKDLHAKRYYISNCNPHRTPKPCAVEHDEWFKISEEEAREAVVRWQRFSHCTPYNAWGRLNESWANVATHSSKKGNVEGGPSLAVWIETHVSDFQNGESNMQPPIVLKKDMRSITWKEKGKAVGDDEGMIKRVKKRGTWLI